MTKAKPPREDLTDGLGRPKEGVSRLPELEVPDRDLNERAPEPRRRPHGDYADDPVREEEKRREQGRRRRRDQDQLRKLMMTTEGRGFVFDRLVQMHVFSTPFVPGDRDATTFAYGEHNMGLMWNGMLMQASLDLYLKMLSEARDRGELLND